MKEWRHYCDGQNVGKHIATEIYNLIAIFKSTKAPEK